MLGENTEGRFHPRDRAWILWMPLATPPGTDAHLCGSCLRSSEPGNPVVKQCSSAAELLDQCPVEACEQFSGKSQSTITCICSLVTTALLCVKNVISSPHPCPAIPHCLCCYKTIWSISPYWTEKWQFSRGSLQTRPWGSHTSLSSESFCWALCVWMLNRTV